jgi:hypothetical protein
MARQTASNACSLRAEVILAMMKDMEFARGAGIRVRRVLVVLPPIGPIISLRQHLAPNVALFNSTPGQQYARPQRMFKTTRSPGDLLMQLSPTVASLCPRWAPWRDFPGAISRVAPRSNPFPAQPSNPMTLAAAGHGELHHSMPAALPGLELGDRSNRLWLSRSSN